MFNDNVSGTRKEYDSHHRLTKRARGAAVPIFDIEARVPAARPSPLHYLCMCRPTPSHCVVMRSESCSTFELFYNFTRVILN